LKNLVSLERLKEVFEYCPETGIFTRLVATAHRVKVGEIAGSKMNTGYLAMHIDRTLYLAHRLAWLYIHGIWPNEIDHINGDRTDNRISNLRDIDRSINSQNLRTSKSHSKTGFLGVYPSAKRFAAMITVRGKRHWLGRHDTPEEAHQVYLKAKRKMHEGCTI